MLVLPERAVPVFIGDAKMPHRNPWFLYIKRIQLSECDVTKTASESLTLRCVICADSSSCLRVRKVFIDFMFHRGHKACVHLLTHLDPSFHTGAVPCLA